MWQQPGFGTCNNNAIPFAAFCSVKGKQINSAVSGFRNVAVLLGLQFGLQDAEWWKSARLRPVALTAADIIDSVIDFAPLMRKQELLDFSKLPL